MVATSALIAAGISAGASAYAAHKQAKAVTDSTKTQSEAVTKAAGIDAQGNKEALDWAKQVYNREGEQQAPYVGAGGAAATSLSQLMGLGTPAPWKPITTAPGAYDPNAAQGPMQAGIPAAPGVNVGDPRLGAPGQLVRMVAPTGEESDVPADQVAHWTAKGATLKSTSAPMPPMIPPSAPQAPTLGGLMQQRSL